MQGGSMAAAMNVSQTPPSFCNCARRAPSKIAEVFGHFFCARIRKPFKYSGRMPTSRLSEHFFFTKLSPKFIHIISYEGVWCSQVALAVFGRLDKKYRLWFLAFFQKLITCLEYDKGGHAHGYEHFETFYYSSQHSSLKNKQLSSQQLFGGVRHRTIRVSIYQLEMF